MFSQGVIDITLAQQLVAIMVGVMVIAVGVTAVFKDKIKDNKLQNRIYHDDLGRGESHVGKILNSEKEMGYLEKIERELQQARMNTTPQMFVVFSTIFALVVVIVGSMIFPSGIFMPILAGVGFITPRFYIKSRREKFIAKFDEEMVKALRRMAAVLRVGGSLDQSLSDIISSQSIPDIVKYEFSKVYASYKAGFPITESFYELYKSVGSKDTLYLCVAMDIQMETGGDKAEIIEGIANTITEKNLKQKRITAKLAEIDISVKMMAFMPIIFGFLITLLNPDHYEFFTQDLMGQAIGFTLISCIVGGFFIIKQMSKIEM